MSAESVDVLITAINRRNPRLYAVSRTSLGAAMVLLKEPARPHRASQAKSSRRLTSFFLSTRAHARVSNTTAPVGAGKELERACPGP